jgi:cell division transport system permease protein
MRRDGALLPVDDAREAALFFVVAALCFLAALTALGLKSTYGAAEGWTAEVEGEYTVSLFEADSAAAEAAAARLAAVDGVAEARRLTPEEIASLLEPTFGARGVPADLPVPQLIAVSAEAGQGDLREALSGALAASGLEAAIDTHSDWAGDVRRALGTVRLGGLAIVALLSTTAIAVIAFATHAALLARRDIVDVLHIAGARDRFVARLFERRFWVLGLRAGTAGALVALAGAALLMLAARAHPARAGLLPELALDRYDILILLATPLIAALAARIAAHLTVMHALRASV